MWCCEVAFYGAARQAWYVLFHQPQQAAMQALTGGPDCFGHSPAANGVMLMNSSLAAVCHEHRLDAPQNT